MTNDEYRRVHAISSLRYAVLAIEHAMVSDSENWDSTFISDCRDGRDTIRNLIDELEGSLTRE